MCAWSRRERVCVHEHVHERARERVPMLGPHSHLYSPRSTSHSHGHCMRSVLARTCCLDRCSLITHLCARPSQSIVPACIARVPCVYLCVRSRVCSHAGQLACVPSCACEVPSMTQALVTWGTRAHHVHGLWRCETRWGGARGVQHTWSSSAVSRERRPAARGG